MTAQHAQRQGRQVARNVAASLGTGKARPYKHRDEGFLVDLGGRAAIADPGVPRVRSDRPSAIVDARTSPVGSGTGY
jgi:NADH dehydrogenase